MKRRAVDSCLLVESTMDQLSQIVQIAKFANRRFRLVPEVSEQGSVVVAILMELEEGY